MDPYVKITCGQKSVKTKYIDEAGQKPVWDATLNLDLENPDPKAQVLIEVWDKDVTYDDQIGGTKITLGDFLQLAPGVFKDVTYDLMFNGVSAGKIK